MEGGLAHCSRSHDDGIGGRAEKTHHHAVVIVRPAYRITVGNARDPESNHAVKRGDKVRNHAGAARGPRNVETAVEAGKIRGKGEIDPPSGVEEEFKRRERL